VSRKRLNKAGSFARLAFVTGFVCLANVPDLVRRRIVYRPKKSCGLKKLTTFYLAINNAKDIRNT
jgi:hypothetical protein